ncbi:MAG TPA: hypothetical protein PLL53_21200 [Saprospiraceae bacterium]|nr:hypothetical protein [Saprospiraceae bacterium]
MKKLSFLLLLLAATLSFTACDKDDDTDTPIALNDPKVTFEIVVSELKPGVTQSQILQNDKDMEENFVKKQKGFLKRETAFSKDGKYYFAFVHWETLEDAEAAGAAFFQTTYATSGANLATAILFNHYVVGNNYNKGTLSYDPLATGNTYEAVVSNKKAAASWSDLTANDKAMGDNFVSQQPGFINRETAVSKDNTQFFAIVRWATLEDAENAGTAFFQTPYATAGADLADLVLFNHFVK